MYLPLYFVLLILRFVLVFLPQTGYIHPDEHFQYPEIVYGDFFPIHSFRSWEFSCEKPIRSIVFPYIIIGIPSLILSAFGISSSSESSLLSYWLLVLPRLVLCCLSVVHDVCLFKICKLMKEHVTYQLVIFASSYVTLTFFTRTLSNSLEAALFTLLIYLVCKDIHCTRITKKKKKKTSVAKNHVSRDYLMGVVVTIGCFVRPTFVLFAFAPVLYWIKCTGKLSVNIVSSFKNILWCLSGALAVASGIIIIDTVYYNDDHFLIDFPEILSNILQRTVITPMNFIQYNLDFKNVRLHGSHPRYLHFLVNLHMLFPVLGIYGIMHFIRLLKVAASKGLKWNCVKEMMVISCISSVVLLSVIPHQEPRFITPILFPLVFLCARSICTDGKYKMCAVVWFFANILGTVFFGFLHQGGLYPALSSLASEMSNQDSDSTMKEVIFYHTYMPPRYLMAIPSSQNDIEIHDLAGSKEEVLISKLSDFVHSSIPMSKLFIISPGTLHSSFVKFNNSLSSTAKITLTRTFFPHFSTEDLPSCSEMKIFEANYFVVYQKIVELFSLNLYELAFT